MRVQAQRLLSDTEGAGRLRGAPAAYAEFGPTEGELEVMYASDGSVNAPLGVRGGQCGSRASAHRRGRDGELEELPNCARIVLRPGETIVSVSCSGGGYGDPLERDPELVAADVAERYISAERAGAVYGVVLDAAGRPDDRRTQELRTRRSTAGQASEPSGRTPGGISSAGKDHGEHYL